MKKIIYLIFITFLLCGCSDSREDTPDAVYITTEKPAVVTLSGETTVQTVPEITTTETTATTTIPETTADSADASETEQLSQTEKTDAATEVTETTAQEPQFSNRIYLNGSNLVYTGDSFQFTYKISHRNAERATILWKCDGEAGSLNENGLFTAEKKGEVMLTVTDISNGLTDSLTVHVVDTAEDVDFVPLVNGIPIANKTYPVPKDYNPRLDGEAFEAFERLRSDAAEEGFNIVFMSGFRSYEEQQTVYKGWAKKYDYEADRVSARPGHSEHQLGLAIDVNSVEFSFADTPEGIWLAENCWKYGFIIRYKEGTEDITGYMFEPWHIRYLGDIAEEVHFSGLTLEEFLGIDSVYRDPFVNPNNETVE